MADVVDVAGYILEKEGYLSTMKLQKLVYYSQAHHLVTYRRPLFDDQIQAWINGPVVPKLYFLHQGKPVVGIQDIGLTSCDYSTKLSAEEVFSCDVVLDKLGRLTGSQLSRLTHNEDPWSNARKGLAANERSQNPISVEDIYAFYARPNTGNPVFA